MDLVAALADLGAVDHRVPSRPGPFNPEGIVVHHTASTNTSANIPSLGTVQKGRGGDKPLPGPLCNVLIGRDASVHVIADGRANDSGTGDPEVLAAFRAGLPLPKPKDDDPKKGKNFVNGNPFFYDIEVENNGVGEPYPDAQVEITGRVVAAICRANGFASDRVILHKEFTRRKIDWSHASGDETRALVARFLEEDDMPSADEVATAIVNKLNEKGTAFGLSTFGETMVEAVNLGRACTNKLDLLLARKAGVVEIDSLAAAIVEDLGDDLARQLGEILLANKPSG